MGSSEKLQRHALRLNDLTKSIKTLEQVIHGLDKIQKHVLVTLSVLQEKGFFTDEEVQAKFKEIINANKKLS